MADAHELFAAEGVAAVVEFEERGQVLRAHEDAAPVHAEERIPGHVRVRKRVFDGEM